MTITTIDDIATALAAAQRRNVMKVSAAPKGAGAWQSQWKAAGFPGAGSDSPAYTVGSGYTCDKSTAGAIGYTNAAVQNYLARMSFGSTQTGLLVLADRLWSCSGMGPGAGTYTVTTPGSLPARITDSGVGCELWVEQFTGAGAVTGTLTANYVATVAGAKAGVISTLVSTPVIGQMQPVPLQVGDLGISQLTSVVTSNTWTSGSFGMTILKRIAEIPFPLANCGGVLDWAAIGLPAIPNDACLMLMFLANGSTGPNLFGKLDIIDK